MIVRDTPIIVNAKRKGPTSHVPDLHVILNTGKHAINVSTYVNYVLHNIA